MSDRQIAHCVCARTSHLGTIRQMDPSSSNESRTVYICGLPGGPVMIVANTFFYDNAQIEAEEVKVVEDSSPLILQAVFATTDQVKKALSLDGYEHEGDQVSVKENLEDIVSVTGSSS